VRFGPEGEVLLTDVPSPANIVLSPIHTGVSYGRWHASAILLQGK
jgi:hypothetical protein